MTLYDYSQALALCDDTNVMTTAL